MCVCVCVWTKPRENRSRLQIVYLLVTQVQPAGRNHRRGEITWVGVCLCFLNCCMPKEHFYFRKVWRKQSIPKLTCNAQKDTLLFCVKGKDIILHFPSSKFTFKIEKDEFDNQLRVLSIMIFFLPKLTWSNSLPLSCSFRNYSEGALHISPPPPTFKIFVPTVFGAREQWNEVKINEKIKSY